MVKQDELDRLAFVLEHTTDPGLATGIIDRLGNRAFKIPLKCELPASWVRSKKKSGVKMLAYAVTYCGDPEVLDEIASETTQKRVVRGLLTNKNLSTATRARLVHPKAVVATTDIEKKRIALSARREAELIDEMRTLVTRGDAAALDRVYSILYRHTTTSKMVDCALEMLLEADPVGTGTELVATKTGAGFGSRLYKDFWRKATKTSDEVLAGLKASARRQVAGVIAEQIARVGGEAFSGEQGRVGISLAKAVARCSDEVRWFPGYGTAKEVFTDEAVEWMLGQPGKLQVLLGYQRLSATQMKRHLGAILELEPKIAKRLIWGYTGVDNAVVEVLLGHLNGELLDSWDAQRLLNELKDPSSEIVKLIVESLDERGIISYLGVELHTGVGREAIYLCPDPGSVGDLVKRVPTEDQNDLLGALVRLVNYGSKARAKYYEELVLEVPGLAGMLLGSRDLGGFIWGKLASTGADDATIASQLERTESMSLKDLCGVLGAMTRAWASGRRAPD